MRMFTAVLSHLATLLVACAVAAFAHLPYGQLTTSLAQAKAESDVVRLISTKFEKFANHDLFAFEGLTSIAAVPTKTAPATSRSELETGRIVGAAYLASGSTRLHLVPGSYLVFVVKEQGEWIAKFQDARGETISSQPAKVSGAEPVSVPRAYVDHSICYQFDSTIICI